MKLFLKNILSRYGSVDALNQNFNDIETALNNTLSRDGTGPNEMLAPLDMNHKNILNGGTAYVDSLVLGGVEVEVGTNLVSGTAFQRYQFNASGGQTTFDIAPASPSLASIEVYVDGLALPPSEIGVSGTTVVIPPMALGSEVVIQRYTNEPYGVPDASTVNFMPAGTGVVVRTVQDKLREMVSVKDFGAVGNGVADDTIAIQQAVNYALLVGKQVYIPAGSYLISSPIKLDKGATEQFLNISIVGEAKNTTLIYTSTATGGPVARFQPARVAGAPGTDVDDYNVAAVFIVYAPNSTNVYDVHFEGLKFTSQGAAAGRQVIGIFAPRIARSSFRDLRFDDLAEGIHCRNLFLVDFHNIDFRNSTWPFRHQRTAGDFGGTSCTFNRVSVAACSKGLEFDNLVYSTLNGCSIETWASGNYAFRAVNRCILAVNGLGIEKGLGPGLFLEGAANTNYAASTVGGRTMVTFSGSTFGLGNSANTLITQFGIASADQFSVVKRDAGLIFNSGLWIQEFNGVTKIQVSLEYDQTAATKVPTVDVNDMVDFGLTSTDFVSTGAGTRKGRASIRVQGVTQYGTNSSTPTAEKVFCRVAKTANQTFSSGTPANLTFASPAAYFDQFAMVNGGLDGITLKTGGMYRIKVRLGLVGPVPVGDSINVQIRHAGSNWAVGEFFGTNTAQQMIEVETIVPVFTPGTDVNVQCARGASGNPVTVRGDANFSQIIVELL